MLEGCEPHELTAYSTLPAAEPVNAVVVYPMFNLQNPSMALLLSSHRDHPIRLTSALAPRLVASYPLVNSTTEAFISPNALLFTADGSRFLAGSESLLSIFDLSRPGQGPVGSFRTGRKRGSNFPDSVMSMTGILSALAIEEQSGVLAAGTFSRHIGLYDSRGQGDCIGVFCVEGTEADLQIGGSGVTQVIWSPCGRYLYVVERKSEGAMIYDIRKTGQLLGWLEGRKAVTNQRLGVHVASPSELASQEVWAGATDGRIRVWRNPHKSEGAQKVSFEWHGHNGTSQESNSHEHTANHLPAPVSSAVLHPSTSVLASCSGAKVYSDVYDEPSGSMATGTSTSTKTSTTRPFSDNSLKIWALQETQPTSLEIPRQS